MDFIDDDEKMKDYFNLTKEQFLETYSYLKEEDYDATTKKVAEGYTKEKMSKLAVLKELLEQIEYNILCYSDNYLMTKPKEGYKEEWRSEKIKAKVIEIIISDIKEQDKINQKQNKSKGGKEL